MRKIHIYASSRSTAVVLAVLVLFSSPLYARRPAWLKGNDPKYPDNIYIVGVGVGSDLDSARSNARAEISKVFRARIQQTSAETLSETSSSLGAKRGPAMGHQETEMKTSVSTDSLLEGVQIAETWYDKKPKRHYALAVLNKSKIRASLATEIADREAIVESRMAQANAAVTPLEKARDYSKALEAWKERQELVAKKRVVDPAGTGDFLSNPTIADIEKSLAQALYQIQFVVQAESDEPASRLREVVTERITQMGFKVIGSSEAAVSSTEKPVLAAKCRLVLEPFDRGNPTWKFFQWNGTFELAEVGSGRILASSAPSGSEGHTTEAGARTKTRTTGEQAVADEARKQIAQYIFGDAKGPR